MLKVEKLFNELLVVQKRDQKLDKAFKSFIECLSSDHVPFIEFNGLMGYLRAIKTINPSLEEDLSRFLFEVEIDGKTDRAINI